MTAPGRRWLAPLHDGDRPIALPHLEIEDGTDETRNGRVETGNGTDEPGDGVLRFLGEPIAAELFPPAALPLWRACDGSRELASWTAAERETITGWHAAGLVVAAPPARTGRSADLTVVSPHPDDAQLALGGVLAAFGGRVVDVFTEETWTRRAYYAARPALASRLLLAEERVACRVLDVAVELLGQTDGAARPAWAGGFFVADPAAAEPTAVEPVLFTLLVHRLRDALTGGGPVLTPLAVGGHVDHVLAREAVLALAGTGGIDPARIAFYEDMPYSLFADPAAVVARLAPRLAAVAGLGPPRPVALPVPTAAVKREALWAYRLQVTEGITTRILRYGRQRGAEVTADAQGTETAFAETGFAERVWLPETSTLVDQLRNVG